MATPADGPQTSEGSNGQLSFEDPSVWTEPMVDHFLIEPDETVPSNLQPDRSYYCQPADFGPHYVWASEAGTSPSSSVSTSMGNMDCETVDLNLVPQATYDPPQQEFPLVSQEALDPTVHGQPFQDDEPFNREAPISFGDIVNLDMFS